MYSDVCFNKTCAVLHENGASDLNIDSVRVSCNIIASNKTILNETLPFARPRQPCCVQLEVDGSISWRIILRNLAPSHECCFSFSSVETNKRQFSSGYYFSWQCFFGVFLKIHLTQQPSQKEETNCVLLKRRVKGRSGWTVPSHTSEQAYPSSWSELVYVGPVVCLLPFKGCAPGTKEPE